MKIVIVSVNVIRLIFVLLLFVSCSNHDETMTGESIRNGRKINEFESFEAFWNEFTQSLKSNDTLKLLELSIPILEVGTIDASDRTFLFKDREIAQILLFEYQNGGYYDYEKDKDVPNVDMINLALSELPDYKKDSDDQRINNFVFSKDKDGWKLTGLYTHVDNYIKNRPKE